MARYRVVLMIDGSRLPTIEKEAKAAFKKEEIMSVRKSDPSRSRADRLADIKEQVEAAASDVDELKDELQEWFDNLPEQFQSGDKGSELEDAIQALEELKDNLEGVDFDSISFPAMMG